MRYTITPCLASLARTTASALALAALPVAAGAEVPRVVTDIPPTQALVALVMGDLGQPDLLLDQGADPHSFQMRPSQAGALDKADLVVWVGPRMTPWLDEAMRGLGDGAHSLILMHADGTHVQDFQPHALTTEAMAEPEHEGHDAAEAEHDHDHDAEGHDHDHATEGHDHAAEAAAAPAAAANHDHDHDHDHDHAGHSHTGTDPHGWLDPANGQHWLSVIAAELAALDPEHAATYAANAQAAAAEIAQLDARLAAQLAPVKDRPFVVAHDAFGYFAGHYGLTVAGAVALGDATPPGAARLSHLREGLEAGGVVCVFPEAGNSPKQAQVLIEGTPVRLGTPLDPEGALVTPGPDAYAALLQGLADNLTACLAP